VGLFDWLDKGRRKADQPIVWQVSREGGDLTVEDGRGQTLRVPLAGARSVRVVPLSAANSHVVNQPNGWQVALARNEGDILVGKAMADWREARELARLVCERADLPLDELTEKLFSRVGQFGPSRTT
jgi:hypothetical protein